MKKHLVVLIALLVALLAVAAVASATEVEEGAWIQYGELDSITKVAGHNIVNWELVKEPTCTEYGMVKCYCNQVHDGETTSSHVIYIEALGHEWSSERLTPDWGKVVKEAKCNEPGLAVDYCLRCGLENPDVTRTIMTDHVYNDKHYQVVYPATCTEYGWAVHTCIYCDMVNPDDAAAWKYVTETPAWGYLLDGNTNLIKLPYVKHAWTKWNITESTCDEYGEAKRACEVCGATQELNVYQTEVLDQGKKIKIDDVIPLKNAKWNEEVVANLDGKDFNSENALNEALAKIKNCKYEVVRNWLADCYTREITVACPYCYGTDHQVHDPVTYRMIYPLTCAHEWALCEEESIAPTCTEEGTDVYLCIHDHKMADEYDVWPFHGHPETKGEFTDPAKLEKPVAALGHDWSEWTVADTYVNEAGETVIREVHTCKACGATENRVVNQGEEVLDNGLIKQADGSWKYFIDGEFQDEYTGFVKFQGGDFWVTNGVVDSKLNGLINCPGDKWLFFSQGQVQRVTQWAEYAGEWFMIKNGELQADATGLYDYNGGTFAVAVGRKLNVNGLWQDPKTGKWVFLANGQLQKVTQEVTYDGATFNVVDGVLAE